MKNKMNLEIGIIGLGLMGGSFGKALKKYNIASNILGYDHNKQHQKQALELSLVDHICTFNELLSCDMIVLTIPVDAIIKLLPQLEDIDTNTTIIDFGSKKN